ncbi:syntaxin 8 isoform X2 [Ptiloglossa arizonensis]
MEQLTARNKYPKVSQGYANICAGIKFYMKQYRSEVQQLKNKLDIASQSKTITIEEAERRTRQIEILQSKDIQLQKLYDGHPSNLATSRANLLTSRAPIFADGGTTSWAADDDDDDKPIDVQVSVTDLKAKQDEILQEQDRGLEELRKVIIQQKAISQAVNNEVVYQNEIIDNLADHMDHTDESLIKKTRGIKTLNLKHRTCGYWVVIILLFICIITVSLIDI